MKPLARKTYRVGVGIIFPFIYFLSPDKFLVVVILSFLLGFIFSIEIARRIAPQSWEWIVAHTRGILKEKPGILLGDTYFLLANLIVILCFSREVAIVSLIYLTLGDAASTLVGMKYGHIKIFKGKTVLGSISFLFICIAAGVILKTFGLIRLRWTVLFSGALAGTFMELLPIHIDDNLTVAIFSALCMEFLS